jgi:hypothetical protein
MASSEISTPQVEEVFKESTWHTQAERPSTRARGVWRW